MILRKLKPEEHGLTRKLWEEVFTEDTKEFLDYYYFIKTRENQIYVIEEDGGIQSMLQLNPYRICIGAEAFPSEYIIAVSTRKEYRGRGYMGELLRASMDGMYRVKVPFTFLMPAAEAIYTPYDFRYIYRQKIHIMECGVQGENGRARSAEALETAVPAGVSERDAAFFDAEEMAGFFERNFSGRWQVYAVRDEEYYRTMILEQQSEHGGVRLLQNGKELVGMFAYAIEEELEIREPLILPGWEPAFEQAARNLAPSGQDKIKVYGCADGGTVQEKPAIMARIIHMPTLLSSLRVPAEEELDCSFAVIDPILHENSRVWRLQSMTGEETVTVRETEDSEGVIPVAELTELLFGMKSAEEIRMKENVVITDRLELQLNRIKKLEPVFLNEVV